MKNKVKAADEDPNLPKIEAKSALTLDMKTGEIIYAKNIDAKVYPASTTKLLTALILNDTKKETDLLTYPKSAAAQPSFSLNINIHHINVGDKMTADNALKGLLIYSGNDAAYIIAANIVNKIDASPEEVKQEFSVLMNKKAASLGLKNSHFITPNGLHDPNHYTTAYDMSIIGNTALKNPWILKTVGLKETTAVTESGVKLPVTNRNKIIFDKEPVYDKTCLGGKTGYTEEAGKCLIAKFERNGRQMLGVVMHSTYDSKDIQVFKDMNTIINWSYSQQQTTLYKKDSIIKTVSLSYKPLKFFGPTKFLEVPLVISDNINYYKNAVNDTDKSIEIKTNKVNPWNLNTKTPIGTVKFKERGVSKTYNIYSSLDKKDIIASNKILYTGTLIAAAFVLILVALILIQIGLKVKRRKKTKKLY